MEYQYKCRITAWDFFRLTMRQTYRSMAGMCNLVFTVAMIVLAAVGWGQDMDRPGPDADLLDQVPGHPAGGNLCESQASGGGCTAGCQAYL